MKLNILILLVLLQIKAIAQFPPAAGQIGSTAIHKDSSVFVDWAVTCNISRGFVNISDTSYQDPDHIGTNRASYGSPSNAIGMADNNVVSLGDKGVATLTFNHPIVDGVGYDFAIFENAFDDNFLELAFVEVSSDGLNFVRFPSQSLTQNNWQIPTFGTLNPTQIHNLAGKYKVFYGTPFDLSDLQDSSGIDIYNVTHIRIIDVVGAIDTNYSSYDSYNRIINDPFPTPYWTCGFDLDAVGVIKNTTNTYVNFIENIENIKIYPNPTNKFIKIHSKNDEYFNLTIVNINGLLLLNQLANNNTVVNIENIPKGFYFVFIYDKRGNYSIKKLIIN